MRQPKGVEILDAVTARALSDKRFRNRLLKNPKAVLRKEGLEIPDDVEIVVHENTDDTIHLVLPSGPAQTIDLEEVDITIIAFHTGGT
jgi:hypothetical protein